MIISLDSRKPLVLGGKGVVHGSTRMLKNGRVFYEQHNLINIDLKSYLRDCMYSTAAAGALADRRVGRSTGPGYDNSLFATGDVEVPNTGGAVPAAFTGFGRSGIVVGTAEADFDPTLNTTALRTMATTVGTAVNLFTGIKWVGTLTCGAARQFGAARIGHNLGGTGAPSEGEFQVAYATQSFPTQLFAATDTFTIEWEIYLA